MSAESGAVNGEARSREGTGAPPARASGPREARATSGQGAAAAARDAPGGPPAAMLRFLTHKLRTHSLEEPPPGSPPADRDSGTESDNDAPHDDCCTDVIMKWNDITEISSEGGGCACAAARLRPRTPPERLYDHHSSEEELEVINSAGAGPGGGGRRRGASSPGGGGANKRRWPQPASPPRSDDDDDTKVETPVRFRTWPPLEALRPRGPRSPRSPRGPRSPPRSPRRRRHRPALDFDKMQQLRGVRWRGGGGGAGELSVFCW